MVSHVVAGAVGALEHPVEPNGVVGVDGALRLHVVQPAVDQLYRFAVEPPGRDEAS